jgi:hypothetical protein
MKKRYFNLSILLIVIFLFFLCFHVEAQPRPTPTLKALERKGVDPSLNITYFQINNGAASTTNEAVKLNNTVQGNAGEYRASMNQDFTNAQWHTYSTAPTFNLGGSHGTKTIYFQVKSSRGVSSVVSDSIRLEAPPPQPIPGSGPGPIVTPTPQPYPKTEPPRPPTITSFTINNGATTTTSRFVTLRYTVRGEVTHFRVSEMVDTFPGREWYPHHSGEQGITLNSEGDGLKTVYLQVKDSLGQVSSVARASITLNELPSITSIGIPFRTTTRRVIPINLVAYGAPTHWRISESQDFSKNLQSGPYPPPLTYTISEGFGQKTIYFQVMRQMSDNTILYSNIISHSLEYVPSFGRKNFTISGYDAYEIAKSRAFGFSTIKDLTSDCRMWGNPGGPLVLEAVASRVVGSKCDFFLFSDQQLREGWAFKSYGHQKNCIDGRGDSSADQQPSPGSRDIKFKIHVWADSPGNLFGGPSRTICDFFLNSITLEGPDNARWQDAF